MSDFRTGKCKWCGSDGEVYRDNGFCEDCDNDTIKCMVCREYQHDDNKCRHVFRCQEFTWRGAGADPIDEEMKTPFHRLLSAMGEEFARDLRDAIKSRKFHTWMVAPMIGGGGLLTLYGMPTRPGNDWMDHDFDYGDKLIELGESDRAGDLSEGYRWLVSLYNGKTAKANRTTIAWIDQWLWPLTPALRAA